MSYRKRLDKAFENACILPITPHSRYVFFSDCHRGVGDKNDNFLKNAHCYSVALQYYYQHDFCYIEAGDGDELWENQCFHQILETHGDIFAQLSHFHEAGRLYMLYGNHDMVKKKEGTLFGNAPIYEGIILASAEADVKLCVTHGHQADLLNSVFWKLARFLVRFLWTPLECFGVSDPTSAAKNNTKKARLEKRYIDYAQNADCLLLTGHTHRPTLSASSPYYNCGSCVHPDGITCIELCGYDIYLVKWYENNKESEHSGNIYTRCPLSFRVLGSSRIKDTHD